MLLVIVSAVGAGGFGEGEMNEFNGIAANRLDYTIRYIDT